MDWRCASNPVTCGSSKRRQELAGQASADATTNEIEVALTFENCSTNQYEQVDLVWYYDDSNMVKLRVVMGREENDKTRTAAIIPLASMIVRLRLFANPPCQSTGR
jgi:hypothetical protein